VRGRTWTTRWGGKPRTTRQSSPYTDATASTSCRTSSSASAAAAIAFGEDFPFFFFFFLFFSSFYYVSRDRSG
jgi:hypothetical protein